MSNFAIVSKKSDGTVMARITQDITLSKGQTVFFNDYEEGINFLVKKDIITPEEGAQRLERTAELDDQYGRKTLYNLRAGKAPEAKTDSL